MRKQGIIMGKKSRSALAPAVSLCVLLCIPTTSYAGAIINIYEAGGGLHVQFSGDLNVGSLNTKSGGLVNGALDFTNFTGSTGAVGFRRGTGAAPASRQLASGTVVSNLNTSFGIPTTTTGLWELMSGTTWLSDQNGNTSFYSSAGLISPGLVDVDAHMFLTGGTLAASNLSLQFLSAHC